MNKKIVALLAFFSVVLTPATTWPAPLPTVGQNVPGSMNYLVNPGFENGTYGWTASGGATKTANATAKGEGTFGYDWDSNASSQTLISSSITIPAGLQGRNGLAYCSFKAPSGSPTYTMTVDDGTNNLVTPITISSSSSSFTRASVNFIFPSSGSVRLKISSVASNEPEIYIDSCYLGEASNLSQVSQTRFIGSAYFPTTSSCTWSTSSSSLGSFGTTSACPGVTVETNPGPGTIQTTDFDLPKVQVNNLPPGIYKATFYTAVLAGSAGLGATAINDGTTTSQGQGLGGATQGYSPAVTVGWFTYTTSGNRTFELYGKTSTGSLQIDNVSANWITKFTLEQYPSSADTVFKPDQTPGSWSGYHTVSSGWATTSSTYADPTGATSIVLTQTSARNITCTTGSGSVAGIDCVLPRAGMYEVTAKAKLSDGSAADISVRMVSGSTVIDPGTTQGTTGGNTYGPQTLDGIYNASAAGTITFKLQAATTAGTVNIAQGSPTGASAIQWVVKELDAPMAMPFLTGSVTSNTSGSERIERASVDTSCSASPCTIARQSGSWVSSITRTGTGAYVLNITSGEFSAIPTCTFSNGRGDSKVIAPDYSSGSISSTVIPFNAYVSSTAAAADAGFDIICMGPK